MAEFQDKVILVTGAGLGVGRAAAEALAVQGAGIAAVEITPINLDVTLAHIRSAGGQVRDYICDTGKLMPVQTMVDQVLADWGRIDGLVNCTVVRPSSALLAMDEWDFRRTVEVNLTGGFFLIQQVGRVMRQAGGGVMVHLVASTAPAQGWPELGAFAASQAGLAALACQAGREMGPYGIRVNALCAGGGENWVEKTTAKIVYLCSPAAASLNGQVIAVD